MYTIEATTESGSTTFIELKKEEFPPLKKTKVQPNGDCWYHILGRALNMTASQVRALLAQWITEHKDEDPFMDPNSTLRLSQVCDRKDVDTWIAGINGADWGGYAESVVAANLFEIKICLVLVGTGNITIQRVEPAAAGADRRTVHCMFHWSVDANGDIARHWDWLEPIDMEVLRF